MPGRVRSIVGQEECMTDAVQVRVSCAGCQGQEGYVGIKGAVIDAVWTGRVCARDVTGVGKGMLGNV